MSDAEVLVKTLEDRDLTLATCESLTGGGIAVAVTDIPGASKVFRGGLITYQNDLKVKLAGVARRHLEVHGAITEQTAVEMASGALTSCGADIGLACSGVAGPEPVGDVAPGVVWLAIVMDRPGAHGAVFTRRLELDGDRAAIRSKTIDAAIELLLRHLSPER